MTATNPIADAIDGAEDVHDPLDMLMGRAADDAGAPFTGEALAMLAALKKSDRAAFESARARLKAVGCRVSVLDVAIAEVGGEGAATAGSATHAQLLIELAGAAALYHAPDKTCFADIEVSGHRETWPIRGRGFSQWLGRGFYERTGGAPGSEALQGALNVIQARALFEGAERTVHVRVAGQGGRLYLDLGDTTWQAIEIDATGWRVIAVPPVRFRRSAGMRPLPMPERGGSVEVLRSFLNVRSDADFVLAVAWLLACLRDRGPYPVIVLAGEQGTAKSTFTAMLRTLIDPNTAALRALPREERDLFIAAGNAHVLAFDNVSGLPGFVSDTLCRLATGASMAIRQLYSDQDEILFEAARPVMLNGIEDIVNRADLASRALFLTLEPIPEERRRPESELWAAFDAEKPRLLGALLDAVAMGLKRLPHTKLARLPRMADFAIWATACEGALWAAGTFMAAYDDNRADAVESVIESDPVAACVRAFMADRADWSGTATELLAALANAAGERIAKSKTWPGDARALANRLRRAATFLRQVGIAVDFVKVGRERTRVVHLASVASAPPADAATCAAKGGATGEKPVESSRTLKSDADADRGMVHRRVRASSSQIVGTDDADAADADRAASKEERAAIAEYDGGLSHVEAERLAAREYPDRAGKGRAVAEVSVGSDDGPAGEVRQMITA